MLRVALTPKWKQFHESLARTMKVALVLISAEGELTAKYNVPSQYSQISSQAALVNAYHAFFRSLVSCSACAGTRTLIDPLCLPVAVLPVEDGMALVVWAGFDEDSRQFDQQLTRYGLNRRAWTGVPSISRSELDEKVDALTALYGSIARFINRSDDLGDRMMLLTAVEEIDKLMVSSLNPVHFDLSAILDLVVSSLIILLDAEGSYIFTQDRQGKMLSFVRGQHSDRLEGIESGWRAAMDAHATPDAAAAACVQVARDVGLVLEVHSVEREGNIVFMGVANASGPMKPTLLTLSRQVAIAMEMASLHEALQQQVGLLLNAMHHGVIVVNRQREMMLVNGAAMDSLDLLGINTVPGQSLVGVGIGPSIEEALVQVAEEGVSSRQQQSSLSKGDLELHFRWTVSPVRWGDEVVGALLLFEDVTEMVNLRHQMYNRDKLVTAGEVAAGLAHEIRNPLATALAGIQLLQMTSGKEKSQDIHAMIASELDRINESLTTFLDFARPAERKDLVPVDLGEVIREVQFMIAGEAHLYGIQVDNRVKPGELPLVLGEPNRFKQVFINICKNAFEAMEDQGYLEIVSELGDRYLWVGFRDNGPGVSNENLQNLVRPFFTTKLTGTGLGLSISSAIVRELGGELRIESQPGQGTIVWVGLPPHSPPVSYPGVQGFGSGGSDQDGLE